jgi:hypothetical protein
MFTAHPLCWRAWRMRLRNCGSRAARPAGEPPRGSGLRQLARKVEFLSKLHDLARSSRLPDYSVSPRSMCLVEWQTCAIRMLERTPRRRNVILGARTRFSKGSCGKLRPSLVDGRRQWAPKRRRIAVVNNFGRSQMSCISAPTRSNFDALTRFVKAMRIVCS